MKSSKIVLTLLFFFLIGISSVQSQNNELMQNLTKEQQNLVKQQREIVVANRDAFKATLTAEQLSILDNKELTKQDRLKKLTATFTTKQKELIAKNKQSIDALKETFKNTMTMEQHQQMQSQNMSKMHEMNSETSGHRKHN
jgi:hypothetical protein